MLRSQLLTTWFRDNREQLPREPFTLRPGVVVSDPDRFYRTLEQDIATGPTVELRGRRVTRQRWQPLLQDLAALRRAAGRVTGDAA